MGREEQRRYWFGDFELEVDSRTLRYRGEPLAITPRAFETLQVLVEHAGRTITKDALLERVWADTHVEEATLVQNIFTIRRLLAEKAPGVNMIETVPKLGYRFSVQVRDTAAPLATGNAGRSRRLRWLGAAAVAVTAILILGGILVIRRKAEQSATIRSIAVLPFENLSGHADEDFIVEGVTDELTNELARNAGLAVISRTSAMQYQHTAKPVRQIGRELGVDAVLEGSVAIASQRVRVSTRLVRAADDRTLWVSEEEGDVGDLLVMERKLAFELSTGVRAAVQKSPPATEQHQVSPAAREAYLKGRYAWNRRTEQGYLTAIEYFNQAIAADPNDAASYAGLADAYALLGSLPTKAITRADAMARARQAATRAIALDDSLAAAHTSLAFVRMHYDYDWNGAESSFRRALQLNPNYATAHQWYAYLLMATGRVDAAIAEMRVAERLDPLSMIIHCDLSELLRLARRYREAEQQARRAVELDPSFVLAHFNLGMAFEAQGRFQEARNEYEAGIRVAGKSYWLKAALTRLYARENRRDIAKTDLQRLLKDLPHESGVALQVASVYAALGDINGTVDYLQRAFREHDGSLILIRNEIFWDPIRSDARFQAIVHELGLS